MAMGVRSSFVQSPGPVPPGEEAIMASHFLAAQLLVALLHPSVAITLCQLVSKFGLYILLNWYWQYTTYISHTWKNISIYMLYRVTFIWLRMQLCTGISAIIFGFGGRQTCQCLACTYIAGAAGTRSIVVGCVESELFASRILESESLNSYL